MIPGIVAQGRAAAGGGGPPADTYDDLIMTEGPLGYWLFDETSGTAIADQTTNHNATISGTYTLGITAAPGVSGTGIKFTNAAVDPTNISTLPVGGATGFANEFLIKLFTADSASNAYIQLRQNSADTIFNFGGANRVGIFKNAGAGGNVASAAFGPTVPRDDAWHHIVIGWNPANSRYEAYLDGSFDSSFVQGAPTLNNTVFRIGRVASGSSQFVGGLSRFAAYDHFPGAAGIAERAALALT